MGYFVRRLLAITTICTSISYLLPNTEALAPVQAAIDPILILGQVVCCRLPSHSRTHLASPYISFSASFIVSSENMSAHESLALAPEPPTELGRYRILSSTAGVRVSPLCLGALSIGSAWRDVSTCNTGIFRHPFVTFQARFQ